MFIQFNLKSVSPKIQSPREVAIVFVHGFTGDAKWTWGDIPSLLEQQQGFSGWDLFGFGYDSKRRIDIRSLWSSDASLEEISTMLLSTPELANYRRIALVAHSMGGLVVQRALVKSEELLKRTSHVVFFGTPSAGLGKTALLVALKQQIRDMNASGEFIRQLRGDWTARKLDEPPFRFLAVAGERDQFVPPRSSIYPFAERFRAVIPGDHLTMLQTNAAISAPVVKTLTDVFTRGTAVAGPRNSAALAVEEGEFQRAIEELWPIRAELDHGGVALLALALDAKDRRDDAIAVLRAHGDSDTDACGVLAGRYKRRWLVGHRQADLDSAFALYRKAYDATAAKASYKPSQAFYHGVNLAYLKLATDHFGEARALASEVLRHCEEDAKINEKDVFWRLATEGDANTILGRKEDSLAKHKEAAGVEMSPWQALSIEEQAVRIADLCGWSNAEQDKLADLYLPH